MANTWRHTDRFTRLVLASYAVLALTPFVVASTRSSFWEAKHSLAPIATVAFLVLLVALVLRRRWAWWLLVIFEAIVLIGIAVGMTNPLDVVDLASFIVLVSGPMRRYVARPPTGLID